MTFLFCMFVYAQWLSCAVRVSPFGETGNYLQFAEKANLPLTTVLKLQFTAGAAYKKAGFVCLHSQGRRERFFFF